jgi:FMN-dependent NADH-azoreductase
MSNVLLVTCSADSTSHNLRRTAAEAIHVIDHAHSGCSVRERHLYCRALPEFGADVVAALMTPPQHRTPPQWRAAAFTDLLLQEARVCDVLVIAAAIEDGRLPKELLTWSEHVAQAAQFVADPRRHPAATKTAILISETRGPGGDLAHLCEGLRNRLKPIGVDDVALFEADAEGYPLKQAPLMLVVSRSALLH